MTRSKSKPGQSLPRVRKLSQDQSLLLRIIPTEIKDMIYKNVLVTAEPLIRAHELISGTSTVMESSYQRVGNIDARLLRTCREIYQVCRALRLSNPFAIAVRSDCHIRGVCRYFTAATLSLSISQQRSALSKMKASAHPPTPAIWSPCNKSSKCF